MTALAPAPPAAAERLARSAAAAPPAQHPRPEPVRAFPALALLQVVVVSKTFTTAETMLNARTLRDWLIRSLGPSSSTAKSEKEVVAAHVIAVSAAVDKCRAFGIEDDAIFGFWDWVGGRYSVCSSVGVVPLALQYSFPIVRQFLDGAHDMDNHFRTTPLERVSQPPAAPAPPLMRPPRSRDSLHASRLVSLSPASPADLARCVAEPSRAPWPARSLELLLSRPWLQGDPSVLPGPPPLRRPHSAGGHGVQRQASDR